MRIGILQAGYVAPELRAKHGDFDVLFSKLLEAGGFEFASYGVVDLVFPEAVDECDGWIITGSKHDAYGDMAFIQPLKAFIRAAYARDVLVFGACFGHQIMAQALGGRVEKSDKGWILGPQTYETLDGKSLRLNAWHRDQVVEKPKDAKCIARNPECTFAAFSYGRKGLSFQAHPEFSNEIVADYLEMRGRISELGIPAERIEAAVARNGSPNDSHVIAKEITDFFWARA